jgi:hypothetical protein
MSWRSSTVFKSTRREPASHREACGGPEDGIGSRAGTSSIERIEVVCHGGARDTVRREPRPPREVDGAHLVDRFRAAQLPIGTILMGKAK